MVNREDEAKNLIRKFAQSNKTFFSDEDWNNMIIQEKNKASNQKMRYSK